MTDFSLTDLGQQVDRLASKDAIRELVTSYAIACDEHDMDRLMGLFTQDAAFDAPNGAMVADGWQAIYDMFIATFKTRGPSYHWTHDVTISIDQSDSNRATGLVLGHAETCPNGVVSIAAMRYVDDYRRESDGVWRFAKRVITFLYYVPVAEFGNGLAQSLRVHIGGDKIAADYPEHLPVWQAFTDEHGPIEGWNPEDA